MDMSKSLGTITGSLVRRPSQENSQPTENERKLAVLLQLGSHYWTPDFTPSQAKHLLADYLEDLERFTLGEVEVACRDWRRNVANKKFPRSAEIVELIRDNKRHVVEASSTAERRAAGPDGVAYPDGKSRPCMWWHLSKQLWKPDWREADVPVGELIRDTKDSPLRHPERFRA